MMIEYELADSKDANDLVARLESLRETWEISCPGFHKCLAFHKWVWVGVNVQSKFMGGCTFLEYIYGWLWVFVTV